MPYKFETEGKLIPRNKDRRLKLTHDQINEIKLNELNLSQRGLAAKYNVSRRTITFILDPAKKEQNLKRRAERGGWKQYYDKDKWVEAMREHRRYKKKIEKELI